MRQPQSINIHTEGADPRRGVATPPTRPPAAPPTPATTQPASLARVHKWRTTTTADPPRRTTLTPAIADAGHRRRRRRSAEDAAPPARPTHSRTDEPTTTPTTVDAQRRPGAVRLPPERDDPFRRLRAIRAANVAVQRLPDAMHDDDAGRRRRHGPGDGRAAPDGRHTSDAPSVAPTPGCNAATRPVRRHSTPPKLTTYPTSPAPATTPPSATSGVDVASPRAPGNVIPHEHGHERGSSEPPLALCDRLNAAPDRPHLNLHPPADPCPGLSWLPRRPTRHDTRRGRRPPTTPPRTRGRRRPPPSPPASRDRQRSTDAAHRRRPVHPGSTPTCRDHGGLRPD